MNRDKTISANRKPWQVIGRKPLVTVYGSRFTLIVCRPFRAGAKMFFRLFSPLFCKEQDNRFELKLQPLKAS